MTYQASIARGICVRVVRYRDLKAPVYKARAETLGNPAQIPNATGVRAGGSCSFRSSDELRGQKWRILGTRC